MTDESPGAVMITGGSRGIGLGTARVMGRDGWKVTITGTTEDRLATAKQDLAADGFDCHTVCFAVEDEAAWSGAVADTEAAFGPLSALVLNAGISPKRDGSKIPFGDDDGDAWQQTVDVNLMGVVYGMRAVLPGFKERGGSIVAISSIVGRVAVPLGSTYYAASKAAVVGLVQSAAFELGGFGIRVNAVLPGRIATDMVAAAGEELNNALIPVIALGRLGEPEEVGEAINFLCGPRASYITGICLDATGGWHSN
jgi:3-oxoacyl-[acyl-carrier protein] reductase